ncbi:MAG: STAS/SEC14 domain-containing protein [Crocinitomicaceae bacterium]
MIETRSAFISKIDEDTLKVIFKPNAYLTVEEYGQLYKHYQKELGKSDAIKFLIIIQEGFKTEKKYLQFFMNHYRTDFKKAEAYIIVHPSTKMFFKVGTKMVNHKYPIKLFEKEAEALSWLKSLK